VTDDEILEKARVIEKQKKETDYRGRLTRARRFAETVKEKPVWVIGQVERVFGENGALGYQEVEKVTEVFSRLPQGTKVKVTIEVIEISDKLAEWDDED